METTDFTFSFDQLAITMQDLLNIAPSESKGLEDFALPLTEVLSAGKHFIKASGGYRIVDDIEWLESGIRVKDTLFETGKIIAKPFRKAEKMVVFACTAGPGVREAYNTFMAEGDALKAFITDMLGTVAVEKAMDNIHEQLRDSLKPDGLHCSNRYSPGYCGWSVEEQQKLWQFLPENYCGIRLTESSLMLPIKSVSGIIAVGAEVRKNPYSCAICSLDQCIYRRRKRLMV
jgi:hypothetical protein